MSGSCRSISVLLLGVLLLGLFSMPASAGDFFTLEKTHKYLGFSTIILAGATGASNGELDTHEPLAYATAGFALSTLLTGYLAHHDRFSTDDGFFTQDNTHIMAGALGAILLTAAVFLASDSYDEAEGSSSVESSHAGLAMTGGVLMGLAIIDIEW